MSEFTYTGECPHCGKRTTFLGGSSKATCDECNKEVDAKQLVCVMMV